MCAFNQFESIMMDITVFLWTWFKPIHWFTRYSSCLYFFAIVQGGFGVHGPIRPTGCSEFKKRPPCLVNTLCCPAGKPEFWICPSSCFITGVPPSRKQSLVSFLVRIFLLDRQLFEIRVKFWLSTRSTFPLVSSWQRLKCEWVSSSWRYKADMLQLLGSFQDSNSWLPGQ